MTRNYNMKICDARVYIETATTPEWRTELEAGDLKNILSENCKPILRIARHMRTRPEAVLQLLSDAFDESLTNHALAAEDGCLCFESNIATITLDPGEDGLSWELKYKANEAMYCKNICRHPNEVFHVVPGSLFSCNVVLPYKSFHCLTALTENLGESPSVELFDILDQHYLCALREKTFTFDANELTLCFKTRFRTPGGQDIYATIEPHYYDPIPNTWTLSRFWCAENQV